MDIYDYDKIISKECPKCGHAMFKNRHGDASYNVVYLPKSNSHFSQIRAFINEDLLTNNENDIDLLKVTCIVCGYERLCYCKDYKGEKKDA